MSSTTATQHTLLIVEDDDALRQRLVKSFQKRNFEVVATPTVSATQVTIQTQVFDFALLDLKVMSLLNRFFRNVKNCIVIKAQLQLI